MATFKSSQKEHIFGDFNGYFGEHHFLRKYGFGYFFGKFGPLYISTYGHTGSVLKVKRRRSHLQVRLEEDLRAGRVWRPLLLRRYDVLGVVAADVDARGSRHQQRRVRRQRVGDV